MRMPRPPASLPMCRLDAVCFSTRDFRHALTASSPWSLQGAGLRIFDGVRAYRRPWLQRGLFDEATSDEVQWNNAVFIRSRDCALTEATPEEVRVLVVEDDQDTRETLAMLLESDGYTVATIGQGDQALAAAQAFRPAVVLVDLKLPGIDGTEVTRLLREALGTALVIIAVTGSTSFEDRDQMEDAGVDFVLTKPLAPDSLRRFLPRLGNAA
jgi:CheY-like chemotaxis protein